MRVRSRLITRIVDVSEDLLQMILLLMRIDIGLEIAILLYRLLGRMVD